MCGRFGLIQTPRQVEELFGVMDVAAFPPLYNIAPTQPILMVMAGASRGPGSNLPERRPMLVRWGLLPGWVRDTRTFPLLINARSEEAADKASFRAAMRHRRALVPASGFFEWRQVGPREKQAYWVRPRSGGVIAFGGLMETWHEPGGSEIDTGAILTTAANDDVGFIHHRMPVVVRPHDFERWLDCRGSEPRDVADLMRPVEPGFFEAVPVSDRVNKVANVGPENIEPVEPAEMPPADMQKRPQAAADDQLELF